ncbi:SIR2 family protein [Paenibacillus polymyxa]|nr:SIR2 family protein [Paenibacillus polymyxa]
MNINEFVSEFKNHPVLFIGTGLSLRYLENSYTWDGLLSKISFDLFENKENYYDIKSKYTSREGVSDFQRIAAELESVFNEKLQMDRNGKFKYINDLFYQNMENGTSLSRFKLYIANVLEELKFRPEKAEEIAELKKVRKNIGSIITTNYDQLIERIFEFSPLIGNDILLSEPYGSLYKIHGCVTEPSKVIITNEDYRTFDERYELIRAQLLSLFIHNPIIFIGYALNDDNIKSILKTIFTYIDYNTPEAQKIRNNFLLVEFQEDSSNIEVTDHDIDMNGFSTIRINKIKTDNYLEIYKELASLQLPVSAMDVRKVQGIVKDIYGGGNIKVSITEDIDSLRNEEKVLAIGSYKTIKYEYQTSGEVIANYFTLIEESNVQLLSLIDKFNIATNQYFPIKQFAKIVPELKSKEKLLKQQEEKLESLLMTFPSDSSGHTNISLIMEDGSISNSNKEKYIMKGVEEGDISLEEFGEFLRSIENKKDTSYRKMLCFYDYIVE